MTKPSRIFSIRQVTRWRFTWGDAVVLLCLAGFLYVGVRLSVRAPAVIEGPAISLSPWALPYYTCLSLGRMAAAYVLSIMFTLVYGYMAAHNRRAERILIPLLDVFQSVPILAFLPVVLLSLRAVLPMGPAAELASIVLVFTSQAWNLTFAWYQSLTTIPKDLVEASTIFRFNGWMRFKTLELPFAAISLIWNSMMSWAGGWFFLMAAEIYTVGHRDFRLLGLGAYLQEAANQGDFMAIAWGLGTLVLVIVALDQLVWRPLLAWSDNFKLEMVESEEPHTSWFYDALQASQIGAWAYRRLLVPVKERLDAFMVKRFPMQDLPAPGRTPARAVYLYYALGIMIGAALAYALFRAGGMLWNIPVAQWGQILLGLIFTLLRVLAALLIALAWTLPLGVAIGTSPRLASWLQPLVQVAASLPATALFPVLLLLVLTLPGGINLAAVLLMLMGTQWYLLFNIIAGAAALPQDLKYTSVLLQLSRWERWRTLILPGLFPYIITGAITASGGAWNASIVAEYANFGGQSFHTLGVGSIIAQATAKGDYPLLLAGTLAMILTVVTINRLVWRRLYQRAEEQYRME